MQTPPPSIPDYMLIGVIMTVLGPVVGALALIVFGAVVGSMLALSVTPTRTRIEGLKFIGIGVALALVLTGAAAWALEHYYQLPGFVMLLPVSAAIGAGRNYLLSLIQKVAGWLASGVPKDEPGGK